MILIPVSQDSILSIMIKSIINLLFNRKILNSLKKIISVKTVSLFLILGFELIFSQTKTAVLYSGYTEDRYQDSKKVFDEITTWELFFMESKIPYKVIYDNDLESGIESDFDIIVLPSVEYISEQELAELDNFLAAGKSIISIGSKLDPIDNNSIQFNGPYNLFGLSPVSLHDDSLKNYIHSIGLNSINAFSPDDAGVIQITSKNYLMVIQSETRDHNYVDYLFNNNYSECESAISYGTEKGGKYLWTGFGINDVIGGRQDTEKFKKLIINAIRWMDNEPFAFITPGSREDINPSLLLIELNNALDKGLLDVLNKNKIPFHLVIAPGSTITDTLISKVAPANVVLDLGSLSGVRLQKEALSGTITDFEDKNSLRINSVILNRTPVSKEELGFFDKLGIKNIFVQSNYNQVPQIVNSNQVIIPVSRDAVKNLCGKTCSIYYRPGFNCLSNSDDSLLILVQKSIAEQNIYYSVDDFRNWWVEKRNLFVKNLTKSGNGVEILLVNNSNTEVSDAKLFLDSFDGDRDILVTDNGILLQHSFNSSSGLIEIDPGKIFPGSTRKIIVKTTEE